MAAIFDDFPYKGFDVLIAPPNEADNGQFQYERMLQDTDSDTAFPVRYDSADLAFAKQKYVWLMRNRADKIRLYKFFYRVYGRQKAFWVPSFVEDIRLLDDMSSATREMTISNIGIASVTGVDAQMCHIAVMLNNGQNRYRRVRNSLLINSKTEQLTLDDNFRTGLDVADVKMICFMRLMRLDNDLMEINHTTDMDGVATCGMVFKTAWDLRNVRP